MILAEVESRDNKSEKKTKCRVVEFLIDNWQVQRQYYRRNLQLIILSPVNHHNHNHNQSQSQSSNISLIPLPMSLPKSSSLT